MNTRTSPAAAITALLLGIALAGCGRTPQPEELPAPPPAPATAPANDAAPANPDLPPPDAAPDAPAQPAPQAPPPQESSPVPKPTSGEPAYDAMKPALANANAKIGVPAELRYQVDPGDAGTPLTVHLAAMPQVEGTSIKLSVKPVDGIALAPGALTMQKVAGTEVYRRQYAITRGSAAPAALRVLVTTEAEAGSAFGYFTVPLDAAGGAARPN